MFDSLTDHFARLFRNLSGHGRISEANVRQAMEDIRVALLEADVHYNVVQDFTKKVLEKSIGTRVLASLQPGEQMVQIVLEELVNLMGPVDARVYFVDPPPTIVMMCGLQGAGKTTTCGKLALYLKGKGKNPLLVAADTQRPAAIEQLRILGEQAQVPVFHEAPETGPVAISRHAVDFARQNGRDVVILDTAGRLHLDTVLMDELRHIQQAVHPQQIYLVVDAMVGQDAVNSAKVFNSQLELDGIILTKFDSDTRGGAALSVKAITGRPIKFLGVGEKLQMLEEFHPDRIARRMLGMGDILTLVEKARGEITAKELELEQGEAKSSFTMDDFLKQMGTIRKMGPLKQILELVPGVGGLLKQVPKPEEEFDRTAAIIQSMARAERQRPELIDGSRRRRIARGSGTEPADVSQVIKSFTMARGLMKKNNPMTLLSQLRSLRASPGAEAELAQIAAGKAPSSLGGGKSRGSRLTPEQKRRLRLKRLRGR